MPLATIQDMFSSAVSGKYAIGYFESWNLESLQGVLDAAEETRSPIVIGFNGEFLSNPDREAEERLTLYGAAGKAAAEASTVPCGFIFNECTRDEWTLRAIDEGFNLVMPIDGGSDYEAYIKRAAEITSRAHDRGVAVEGEVGELPDGFDTAHQRCSTHPDQAADFVERTGVDLLAVSAGNVHCHAGASMELDLELLEKIRRRVEIPLVLHGGTGIENGSLQAAIALGAAKVNYGTYLKLAYLDAVRKALGSECPDPHKLLGIGGDEDVMVLGRKAVKDAVLERIHLLGCCGKADLMTKTENQ